LFEAGSGLFILDGAAVIFISLPVFFVDIHVAGISFKGPGAAE